MQKMRNRSTVSKEFDIYNKHLTIVLGIFARRFVAVSSLPYRAVAG